MNNKNILKHPSFWLIILIILLGIAASFLSFQRWQKQNFFGTVTTLGQQEFTIQDPQKGVLVIKIGTNTHILRGKTQIKMPEIHEEVFVIGKLIDKTTVEAKGVRVVDIKNKMKK